MQFKYLVILGLAMACHAPLMAQEAEGEESEYGWSGTGEFGLVKTTGNTDSEAINMKLEFIKTTELWRHRFFAGALSSSKDGVQDTERYQLEAQSDRKLSERSYVFGAFRWDSDKFGSYDPQMSLTAGYGRELVKSDNHLLKGEIGAGYRKLEERLTGVTSSDAIIRLLLDDSWQITHNTTWNNRLLVESGDENTFSQFNTALAVAMNAKFAVKIGYEIRNNSKIPPGSKDKTDTVTTVNLVYNFK